MLRDKSTIGLGESLVELRWYHPVVAERWERKATPPELLKSNRVV